MDSRTFTRVAKRASLFLGLIYLRRLKAVVTRHG